MISRDVHDINIRGPWAETWDGSKKLMAIDNVGVCILGFDEATHPRPLSDNIYRRDI